MNLRFVIGYGIAAAVIAAKLLGCGGLTVQDKNEVAEYTAQQQACVLAHKGDPKLQDACRAEVKKRWCDQWAQRFDAGVCP